MEKVLFPTLTEDTQPDALPNTPDLYGGCECLVSTIKLVLSVTPCKHKHFFYVGFYKCDVHVELIC